MPFIKISGLTTATVVSATNQFEINQNGASRSAEVSVVATYVRSVATDVLVLPAGSTAAPALFPTGDTNTGIFFPAADTIAFSEGGIEVMRLNSSGNVGIGTPTPAARLDVSTSADAQGLIVSGFASFTSRVSISAGVYTGLQNYQDNTLQRPTLRDYALILVARGSVSATATLDLADGNYFEARAAGSTTFVFANPPVSAVGTGRTAGGFVLELQNGGAATVTWPSTVRWPGGTAPSLTAAGFDVLTFITDDGGSNWRGVQSMRDSK
jgi:hypothetical protein